MTDREAMQMALEALENSIGDSLLGGKQRQAAIPALRARLAQPKGLFIDMIAAHGPEFVEEVRRVGENIEQPEQQAEPVAWMFAPNNELLWPSEVEVTNPIEIDSYQPLYTSPPQRKPLTDYMVHRAMIALNTASEGELQPTFDEMKSALEAAHGIKGEA